MKYLLYSALLFMMISCGNEEVQKIRLTYPATLKTDSSDVIFGVKVEDPYRWLEDDNAPEVKAWVEEQNKVTFAYMTGIPYREQIKERLTEMWNFERQSAPFTRAGIIFYYRNNGLQNQSVLYCKMTESSPEKVLIDPNTLSEDGTVSLAGIGISPDGKYIAYALSRGGSDWNEIFVKEIETGKELPDHIQWVKFSGISWYNDGFFYSSYNAPGKGQELSGKNLYHKLYYHRLGNGQEKDEIIRQNPQFPKRSVTGFVTEDQNYLIMSEGEENEMGNSVIIKNLKTNNTVTLDKEFKHDYGYVENMGSDFYFQTNRNADRNRLICVNLDNPDTANWKEIVPESNDLLNSVTYAKGRFICNYLKDAHSRLDLYNPEGKFVGEITLPVLGTVNSFNIEPESETGYYDFTSFNYPTTVYKYNITTNKSEVFFAPKVDINPGDYEVKQVFYTSKDGTRIPMFITYKKGIKQDGKNPTLLYGYGGFNISLTPSFSVSRMLWLENGGIFAMANLRGGGEYGKAWHVSGTKLKKQNVFDDFIAAAEYLIRENYTNPQKLACQGGSNGGLLVGAVINQRPDLFKVAIPQVGVMDMLRYHKFTIGWAWVTDYGSSEDSVEFNYLLKYSPIHNIRDSVEYPAVLVTTADHDDRVVPAHSFKYIATLQEKYKGTNPVLIRVDTKAGHGAGKSTAKSIEEITDMFSFILYNMEVKELNYKKK